MRKEDKEFAERQRRILGEHLQELEDQFNETIDEAREKMDDIAKGFIAKKIEKKSND